MTVTLRMKSALTLFRLNNETSINCLCKCIYSGLEQGCEILDKVRHESLYVYLARSLYIQYRMKETILNIGTISHNVAEFS